MLMLRQTLIKLMLIKILLADIVLDLSRAPMVSIKVQNNNITMKYRTGPFVSCPPFVTIAMFVTWTIHALLFRQLDNKQSVDATKKRGIWGLHDLEIFWFTNFLATISNLRPFTWVATSSGGFMERDMQWGSWMMISPNTCSQNWLTSPKDNQLSEMDPNISPFQPCAGVKKSRSMNYGQMAC